MKNNEVGARRPVVRGRVAFWVLPGTHRILESDMLSERARKIGERPAFPWCRRKGDHDWNLGMTYREFLIGQALANPNLTQLEMTVSAYCVVGFANAILECLAAEESDDHQTDSDSGCAG